MLLIVYSTFEGVIVRLHRDVNTHFWLDGPMYLRGWRVMGMLYLSVESDGVVTGWNVNLLILGFRAVAHSWLG